MHQNNICFCLPGIGANYQKAIGMLTKNHQAALQALANRAETAFGIKIMPFLLENRNADDLLTVWSSNYVCDYLTYQILEERAIIPQVMLGYSMGLITCAACSQAISFEDGIAVLREIIAYHQFEEAEAMVTVIGLGKEEIYSALEQVSMQAKVFIACANNEYCHVLSGREKDILSLVPGLEKRGALKIKRLETHFAFHSPYMRPGIEQYKMGLDKLSWQNCAVPLFSFIRQREIYSGEEMKEELMLNMYSAINMYAAVTQLAKEKVDIFYELGLLKGLTRIIKYICPDKQSWCFTERYRSLDGL